MPSADSELPSSPSRPNVASRPMPATAGGRTSGSSTSVTARLRPGKRRVASRYAVGRAESDDQRLGNECRLECDDQRVARHLGAERVDQLARRNAQEDRRDRNDEERERREGRDETARAGTAVSLRQTRIPRHARPCDRHSRGARSGTPAPQPGRAASPRSQPRRRRSAGHARERDHPHLPRDRPHVGGVDEAASASPSATLATMPFTSGSRLTVLRRTRSSPSRFSTSRV